jgi:hypothetical protein
MDSMFFIHYGEIYANCDGGMFRLNTNGFYESPLMWVWEALTPDLAEEIRKDYERAATPIR